MTTLWLNVYLRQGNFHIPCTSLENDRGFRQEVTPVATGSWGDELALAEALEYAFERSGKRKQYVQLTDDDPGPAGRSAGCRSMQEFVNGLKLAGIEFSSQRVIIQKYRYVSTSRERGFIAEDGNPSATLSMPLDFVVIARNVIAILSADNL